VQAFKGSLQPVDINVLSLGKHHRGLGEAGNMFVHACYQNICTCLDSVGRQLRMKAQVRAPGRIHGEGDTVFVSHRRDSRHICDTADITGLHQHDCPRLGVLSQGLSYAFRRHTGGEPGFRIDIWSHPHRR
jgi:hypothetical protein